MRTLVLALALCFLAGCQKAPEAPKVVVAAAPVIVTTSAVTPAEVTPVPKAPVVATVDVKQSKPKSVETSKPATKSAAKKASVTRVRADKGGFPEVKAFLKMPAKEQRAYLEAANAEYRADCLKAQLDRKVQVENMNKKGIMDWGNVRGTCEAPNVDDMMKNLHPKKVKKSKAKK